MFIALYNPISERVFRSKKEREKKKCDFHFDGLRSTSVYSTNVYIRYIIILLRTCSESNKCSQF